MQRAVVAVVSVVVAFVVVGGGVDAQKLTTPYLEHVFKGKCLWKNSLPTPPPIVRTYPNTTSYCDDLWNRFALTARLPFEQQTNATWAPFFEIADFSSPPNGAMLWSGSYTFTQTLTSKYTTLEETSTGYIMNELWWCPSLEEGGAVGDFNYTAPCVYDDPAPGHYSLAAIWREASRRFADGITGDVVVLLQSRLYPNASDPSAPAAPSTYRSTSIFGSIELPALRPDAVTSIVALYMPGDRAYLPMENCTAGTLTILRGDVTRRFAGYDVPYYCFDDNRLLMKLCTNQTNEELASVEKGVDSLAELLDYVTEFDFQTAQSFPECAVGVLSYMSGFEDTLTVVTPIFDTQAQNITDLQILLNLTQQHLDDVIQNQTQTSQELTYAQSTLVMTQAQLNETQADLRAAQAKIWDLEHRSDDITNDATPNQVRVSLPVLVGLLLCMCLQALL